MDGHLRAACTHISLDLILDVLRRGLGETVEQPLGEQYREVDHIQYELCLILVNPLLKQGVTGQRSEVRGQKSGSQSKFTEQIFTPQAELKKKIFTNCFSFANGGTNHVTPTNS